MEFFRLNGTNRASVQVILIRTATTSELKELCSVKRPFKKRGKNRKKEEKKIKPVFHIGREHSVQHLIPLRILSEKRRKKHSLLKYCCTVPQNIESDWRWWFCCHGCRSHLTTSASLTNQSCSLLCDITDGVMLSPLHVYHTFYLSCVGFVFVLFANIFWLQCCF